MLNLKLGEVLIKMRVTQSEPLADGETVPITFDSESIHLFDAETGLRLEAG